MSRYTFLPLVAIAVWSMAPVESAVAAPALPTNTGDINGDGKRDIADVACYALTTSPWGPPSCQAVSDEQADLQCDGSLNVTDIQRAILIVLFKLTHDGYIHDLLSIKDTDHDLLHNNCDEDDDNDGYLDVCEEKYGTDPLDASYYPEDPSLCE